MKYKEFAFRVTLIVLCIAFFAIGIGYFEDKNFSAAVFYIALAFGMLAFSNVLDPEKKTTLSDAVEGKTTWSFTFIGVVLYRISWLLMAISGWLWLKFG